MQDALADFKPKKGKTKAAVAKKLAKKKIQVNKKFMFDEEGEAVLDTMREKRSEAAKHYEMENKPGIDLERAKQVLQEEDQYDRELFREKIKARHRYKYFNSPSVQFCNMVMIRSI